MTCGIFFTAQVNTQQAVYILTNYNFCIMLCYHQGALNAKTEERLCTVLLYSKYISLVNI